MKNYINFAINRMNKTQWIQLIIKSIDEIERNKVTVSNDTANVAMSRIKDNIPDIKSAMDPHRASLMTDEIQRMLVMRNSNIKTFMIMVKVGRDIWDDEKNEAYYNLIFLLKRYKNMEKLDIEESFAAVGAFLEELDNDRHSKAVALLDVEVFVDNLKSSHKKLYDLYLSEAEAQSLKVIMNFSELRDKTITDYRLLYQLLDIINRALVVEDCKRLFDLLNTVRKDFIYGLRKEKINKD